MQVALQIMLALVACLLGIATNYVTSTDDAPWVLEVIRRGAAPAIELLVVAMVVGQVVVYRLENPAPPQVDWPRDRVPYPGLDAYDEDEAAVYFGWETQAAELARRLHATVRRPARCTDRMECCTRTLRSAPRRAPTRRSWRTSGTRRSTRA